MANMKQNLTCSRSKPPPARSSSYSLGRVRGQMNVDHPSSALLHTTQVQERYTTDTCLLLHHALCITKSSANWMFLS